MNQNELLELKEMIHAVSETKISLDDLLSWVLKQLEELENENNAISSTHVCLDGMSNYRDDIADSSPNASTGSSIGFPRTDSES